MEGKRTTESLLAIGRSLLDAFFREQDRQLVEQKVELRRLGETKEALAAVSGIKNDDILQRLVELKVRPEIVAA